MSSLKELKDVLKDTLEEKGVLKDIRAKIRAEIFQSLQEDSQNQQEQQPSDENKLINQLIKEYLEYNGYNNALNVFIPEASLNQSEQMNRNVLSKKLKITENQQSQQLPLLYSLCFGMNNIQQKQPQQQFEQPQPFLLKK